MQVIIRIVIGVVVLVLVGMLLRLATYDPPPEPVTPPCTGAWV